MGKEITDPGFADDAGAADPAVAEALAAHGRGTGRGAGTAPAVLAALAGARLLIPVVAVPAPGVAGPRDQSDAPVPPVGEPVGEHRTDMAVPTIQAPSGRRALPAFTSLATLRAWNADARPVPVPTWRACQAALAEGADTLLVDPGGANYPLDGPDLRALAAGRLPVAPAEDPEVAEVVEEALRAEPAFVAARLLPADADTDLAIGLIPAAGTSAGAAQEGARRVAAALAAHPLVRDRVGRGVSLALLPAELPAR